MKSIPPFSNRMVSSMHSGQQGDDGRLAHAGDAVPMAQTVEGGAGIDTDSSVGGCPAAVPARH